MARVKTKLKKEKKHELFLDTSVLTAPFMPSCGNSKEVEEKALLLIQGYTSISNTKKLAVSMSVLGELRAVIEESKLKLKRDLSEIEEIYQDFLEKAEIYAIPLEAMELAISILNEDDRLWALDVLNFSCAAVSSCSHFIFIDGDMERSQTLNKYSKLYGLSLTPLKN